MTHDSALRPAATSPGAESPCDAESFSVRAPAGRPQLLPWIMMGCRGKRGDICSRKRALDSGGEARHPDSVARGEHDGSKGHSSLWSLMTDPAEEPAP